MEFEKNLEKIEKIVSSLDDNIKLEDGLKLLEEGCEIVKQCLTQLKDAKNKIDIIQSDMNKIFDDVNEE